MENSPLTEVFIFSGNGFPRTKRWSQFAITDVFYVSRLVAIMDLLTLKTFKTNGPLFSASINT